MKRPHRATRSPPHTDEQSAKSRYRACRRKWPKQRPISLSISLTSSYCAWTQEYQFFLPLPGLYSPLDNRFSGVRLGITDVTDHLMDKRTGSE